MKTWKQSAKWKVSYDSRYWGKNGRMKMSPPPHFLDNLKLLPRYIYKMTLKVKALPWCPPRGLNTIPWRRQTDSWWTGGGCRAGAPPPRGWWEGRFHYPPGSGPLGCRIHWPRHPGSALSCRSRASLHWSHGSTEYEKNAMNPHPEHCSSV